MTDTLASDNAAPGRLIIKPSIANLKQLGQDTMDPYFKVMLTPTKMSRTPIAKGEGQHPSWDSQLELHRDDEGLLRLEVRDSNPDGEDELIGSLDINIGSIIYNQNNYKCWVPMLHKGRERGEVLVEFIFEPDKEAHFATSMVPNLDTYGAPGNPPDDDPKRGGGRDNKPDLTLTTPCDPTTGMKLASGKYDFILMN